MGQPRQVMDNLTQSIAMKKVSHAYFLLFGDRVRCVNQDWHNRQ